MKRKTIRKSIRLVISLLVLALLMSTTACGNKAADTEEDSQGEVTVNFTAENLAGVETAEDGTVTSVTYLAGDREIHFRTSNVSVADDGALLLSCNAEMLLDSGIENVTGACTFTDLSEDYITAVNAMGLFELDEPVDGCIYGADDLSATWYADTDHPNVNEFGHSVQNVYFVYQGAEESDICTLSAITFYCGGPEEGLPENLTPIYVSVAYEYSEEYGDTYSVLWDFSDPSIIVDSEEAGGYLTSLSLYNEVTGGTEVFACDRCRLSNGVLTIEDGGCMTLMTQMGSMGSASVTMEESVVNSGFIEQGYDIYDAETASSTDELLWGAGSYLENDYIMARFSFLCNFIRLYPDDGNSLSITSLCVTYDDIPAALCDPSFDSDFYGYYLEGDYYDATREQFSAEDGIYDFYLVFKADPTYDQVANENIGVVYGVSQNLYTVGNLLSADGTVKDASEPLELGDQIEVTIGAHTYDVPLPVCASYQADTLNELMPANTAEAEGTVNVLVVPLCFEDQADTAAENDALIRKCLGRILSEDGTVIDYSDGNAGISFSEYFDEASYGNLTLNSFVTDWYTLSGTYAEESGEQPDDETLYPIRDWVNTTYADMLPYLDQNGDGLYDAVIFLTAPSPTAQDSYVIASYQGAYNSSLDYDYMRAVTDGTGAGINHFAGISLDFCGTEKNCTTGTICHEFSHQLGLIDYYDVYYTGIDAIGGYDMQDTNEGDWNAFSKFAAGWTNPAIVTEEDIDTGITLTINAFESDGSAIVVPTAKTVCNEDGTISPFSEYLLIDLFTPEGLYADTCTAYGLTTAGVRIYHVDARMLTIHATDDVGEAFTVGTSVFTNAYNETGRYHLELIQAGGVNTFTDLQSENLRSTICADDLFRAGDTFTASDYSSFFYNGVFDDGSEIDFTITVDSISNGTATITISR